MRPTQTALDVSRETSSADSMVLSIVKDFALLEQWIKGRLPWVKDEEIEQLARYAQLLYRWSARMNLVAPGDRERLATRHLVPALRMGALITGLPHRRIMDFGSGGGLPGVPLKIILKEAEVILVEGRRKRANFLREVLRQMGMVGIRVVGDRLEEWAPTEMDRVDVVVSRAVSEPRKLLKVIRPYLNPYGVVVTTLSPSGQQGPLIVKSEEIWDGVRGRIGFFR